MPSCIEEGNLRFTFDDEWNVVKLDEHPFFRERLMPLQLTRAVDFLGLHRKAALYLIEVKDYRGSAIELKDAEKLCAGDTLFHKIGRKSKDSVACISGAARRANDAFWQNCVDVLHNRDSIIKMVYWLEFDLGRRGRGRSPTWIAQQMQTEAAIRERQLKGRLNWLTREVVVTNQVIDKGALPGVVVENVARSGCR